MMVMIVLPVFILIALGASLPIWPHSKKWGFYPISAVSAIILLILFLVWTGHLGHR
jgi:bacteriorhodopsin